MFNLPKRMFPRILECAVLVTPSSWLQAAPVKLPWTTATARPVTPASPFLSGSGHCYEAHSLSHIYCYGSSPCVGSPLGQGPQPEPAEGKQWESQQSFTCLYSQSPGLALSSELPLTLYYGELFNLLTTYHNIIIINCTTHVMHLNHPQTTAFPASVEKLSSMTSPWCRKRWRPLPYITLWFS